MESLKESVLPLSEGVVVSLQSKTLPELLVLTATVVLGALVSWLAVSLTTSPLRHVPGPFLAKFTNFWRLFAIWSDRYPLIIQKLHKKYGPAVRIGPNTVSLDFPELIKTIHGTDGKFRKTGFYASASAIVDGNLIYTLFGEPDPERHALARRPVNKYYTTGAALELEPHMDNAIRELCSQLDKRFAKTGAVCDMWQWSLFLIWDLSSHIIFSRGFGYLEHGSDFDKSIALSATINSYFQTVGQMPWLDWWLDKNPIVRIGPPTFTSLMKVAVDGYTARLTGADREKGFNPDKPDYLQHFINAKSEYPDTVSDASVVAWTMQHIVAGADTTAIVITAAIYFIISHPDVHSKVAAEVRAAGLDKNEPVPYNVARQLPYLDAVWHEAIRMQPIAGALYERHAPPSGLTLPNGVFIPGGSGVGLNPYITSRNASVFGADAEEFRPERWLQRPGEDVNAWNSRMRVQRSVADFTFGAGSRICLGRNLAIVESYKILATLLNRYDMRFEGPNGGYGLKGGWLRAPKRLMVGMKIRE
ncbi:benzoate 4-monooxygenase [Podospora aff. communis PSN243]|uniref:Benzoate 4-monooxygenase n=1 Tax=Podospora aff. communis PSN243 TaxID=3040156 RepID=A0AAV9H261_9PEZI|nr:benzoate 4-monooxygenase [Podospora aff. communis PSN243]